MSERQSASSPLISSHVIQCIAEIHQNRFDLLVVEGAHTDMFSEALAVDIFEDDAFAETLYILKSKSLSDEFIVELTGDLVFFFQVLAALLVLGKLRFQGLEDDLLAFIGGGEEPARAVYRGIERMDVPVIARGGFGFVNAFEI